MPRYLEEEAFCDSCGTKVVVSRLAPLHGLHALLTLVTVGIWLPVWGILWCRSPPWRCASCNQRVRRSSITAGEEDSPWIVQHFRDYRSMTRPWPFLWRLFLEMVLVSTVCGNLWALLFDSVESSRRAYPDRGSLFLLLVIIHPVLSVLFVAVPVTLLKAARSPFWVQVGAATVVSICEVLLAGPSPADAFWTAVTFYLAFTYAHWLERSLKQAALYSLGLGVTYSYILFVYLCITPG